MSPIDRRIKIHMAAVVATGLLFAACSEIPQDARKPFAGKEETRSYAGAPFNGDKTLYEKALAQRANAQNEYLAIEDSRWIPAPISLEQKTAQLSPSTDAEKTAPGDSR